MAQPTLVDSDDWSLDSQNSVTTKSFTLQAGDCLVVLCHSYQHDSVSAGPSVSDSINGAHTERARTNTWLGESDRTDGTVFVVESSGAGSTTVVINPPGSAANFWGVVLQYRGGTFTVAGDTDASSGSLPLTATIGSLSSGDYLMAGVAYLDANPMSSFAASSPAVEHHGVFNEDWYANSFATRTQEGVTSVSMTWAGSATIDQVGYAAVAIRFEAEDSSIEGVATATLDAATVAGTGTLALAGQVSTTLAAATVAGAGTLALSGQATSTLGDATVSASGALALAGAATPTLDAATTTAAGTLALSGSASPTLDAAMLSGAAGLSLSGAASLTLAAATLAATGQFSTSPVIASITGDPGGLGIVTRGGRVTLTGLNL
jgi:hypothetical protein